MTDQKRREQIAFPNQSQYSKEPRPARQIPTREQLEAAALRQAAYEAAIQEADESYSGFHAGIEPAHRPFQSQELTQSRISRKGAATQAPVTFDAEGDYELEEDDSYYETRPHTSSKRYQGYDISPEQVYQSGNKRYHVRVADIPSRKSRVERGNSSQPQLPPQRQRPMYADEIETPIPQAKQRKRSIHPLLYLVVGMLAMAALFLLLSSAISWFQIKMDDITYGRPRVFQTDAVVGHNDSPSNPSHFIAINLNRHVQVIEIPGGDASHERTFQVTTLFGTGQDLTPVTLSFVDLLGNGKLDMLIHIQDTTIAMINENGTFRPTKPGEVKGLLN